MTFRLVTDTFAQLDVPLRSLRLKSPTLHNSYLQEAEADCFSSQPSTRRAAPGKRS